ncbi:MAG: oligosaccharide flippase family protein [Thiotrichaceae bacterium]|nr:oligosaccharide flippase family protein [Thiotrichaceae bacterium]
MSLKKNVLANYLGQGWRAIMSLAFVPLYIKYLGIEAYGLIGIFVMLQAWLSLLDMGMKPALGREMARFTGGGHDAQSIWNLLRSIEIVAFCLAVVIAVGIWSVSGWLATNWVQAERLPVSVMTQAFILMGLVVALRFIENIYTSSIAGLQRQVLQNVVTCVMATLSGLGSVVVLVWVSPTIEAFFIWQGLISLITAIFFMIVVYCILPQPPHTARFSMLALIKVWRFAAGMLGITLLALLLMQVDKILLSRLLSLEDFGYYVLAGLVAGGLYILITPVGAAFYPRFTELVTRQDDLALKKAYHLGAQLVTVVMGSAAVMLIVFSERILLLWTGDPELTGQVAPIMSVLALGTFLNGLMWMPYQMQLAHGWTSLSIRINIVAVILLVPAILWVVPIYGAIGTAWVWVVLNAGYCLIGVHFMYRRILISEKWIWYRNDVLIPIIVAAAVALLCCWGMPVDIGRVGEFSVLLVSAICVLVAAAVAAPIVRVKLTRFVLG